MGDIFITFANLNKYWRIFRPRSSQYGVMSCVTSRRSAARQAAGRKSLVPRVLKFITATLDLIYKRSKSVRSKSQGIGVNRINVEASVAEWSRQ